MNDQELEAKRRSRRWRLAKWAFFFLVGVGASWVGERWVALLTQQPVPDQPWGTLFLGLAGVLGMYGATRVGQQFAERGQPAPPAGG